MECYSYYNKIIIVQLLISNYVIIIPTILRFILHKGLTLIDFFYAQRLICLLFVCLCIYIVLVFS
ncbi:hypothetical protein BDC45DRAFT_493540 [Circinella umbellata]|nr:hypothetical protein BDC45DRAFT_493540 [Circinella umbellata]